MTRLIRYFVLSSVLLLPATAAFGLSKDDPPKTVRIGVLAVNESVGAARNWQPMTSHLDAMISGYRFEIVPMSLDATQRAVDQKTVDFLIARTDQYILLEHRYGISRLATLRSLYRGLPYSKFGAVIITRAKRTDINTLGDLRNHSFMAVDEDDFAGWQVARYEFHKRAIDPFNDFSRLDFSGQPQDRVPLAVLQGKVDAGTVRTGVLERMANEGQIRLEQFRVLNPRRLPGFPFLASSELYPERMFAKLSHVDSELAKRVQLSLLVLDEKSPAAQASHSAGWTVPLDYSGTRKMMNELALEPFVDTQVHWAWKLLQEYWIVLLVLTVISVPAFWYYVIQLYISSRDAERKHKQAETEWLQAMDLMTDSTILLDLDDRVVRANKAFYKQVNKTSDEVVGRKVTDFFHPEGEEVPCPVCQARHDLQDKVITVEADEPQNRHHMPMEISIRVVRDADGKAQRVIQSIRDLTDVRAREQALARENLILQQIVRGTARTIEEDYFRDLVRVAAETLGADFAFVSEIEDPEQVTRVRAFAIWGNKQYLPAVEYDLAGTPCENVVGKEVCFYGDDVQQLFPEDELLVEMGVRSYLGVPFFNSAGKPLGHIAIMHSQPLTEEERYSAIMQIFADRVGVEIERQQSTDALKESEERFKGLFDTAPDPTIIVNERGSIVLANSRFEEQFGYEQGEIIGQSVEVLVPGEFREHHPKMRDAYLHQPIAREMGNRPELMAVRKDGSEFSAEIALSPLETHDGVYITAVIRDVTTRKLADRELERLASFPMMSPIPVMEVDLNGRVTYENPVSTRLFPDLHRLGFKHPLLQDINEVMQDLQSGMRSVVRDVTVDGAIYEQQLSYITESAQLRIYSWDVTNLHEMSKQMHHQATHDSLTGLVNRREFEQMLERAIQSAVFEGKSHVLCYIDLDQFKIVNDICGHGAGDELLRQLTGLLKKQVRDADHLARLGGDEFGLLLVGCPMERARDLTEKLRQVISAFEFVWEGQSFRVGASMGLVEINHSSGSLAEVMSAADSACYAAKDLGRNRIFIYHPDDAVVSRNVAEMNWTHRIRQALIRNEFLLFYQTIEPLKPSGEKHCEILVRMIDSDGKLILPGAFIPAAERFGLMAEVDFWVISQSLENIRLYPDRFDSYSINLSGQTLGNPSSMNWIVDTISTSEVDPDRLCFEITETAMISNFSVAEKYIRILRGMGCKFSLDDFGTGLSSFSYLKNLPVDRLKIDSHFVRDIVNDEINATMVMSINIVGQSMKLKTVAEGVEDIEILEMLEEIGIDYAQGYAISMPELLSGQCVKIDQARQATAK